MTGCIAVLNAGSSSIKFALYEQPTKEGLLFRGKVEQIGVSPKMEVVDTVRRVLVERSWPNQGFDQRTATREVLKTVIELIDGRPVAVVGHRVVHGGVAYAAPVRVDAAVFAALNQLKSLAPLHQPHNLAPIETIAEAAPQLPQVACFDTAFHHTQPPLAQMFALPRRFTELGVRRYGFHGLSYDHVSSRLAEMAPELFAGRVIVAHLGNGSSLCAMRKGRSLATTMGFTAADGLMMGSRSGSLDPGVLIHLMDTYGMGPRDLEDLIYRRSGLLGVSGVSSDMQALRASAEPAAAEAIALFVYRIVREIGSMAAALGGVDGIVFTGGIGQNDPGVRAEIAAGGAWLGLQVDAGRNSHPCGRISADGSPIEAWVIPTDEELVVASQSAALLGLAVEPVGERVLA
jgi:acetate kinase